MFALLMEPYAMIQVSIPLSVMNQMGRNFASMLYFCVSAEPLEATRGTLRFRGTPVEKHWPTLQIANVVGSAADFGNWHFKACVSLKLHVLL